MKTNKIKGFTLIELLIVIAIIGILVTIAIIAINPVRLIQDARDSTRRADLQQIKAAMQLFYNSCKFYPPTLPSDLWDGSDFAGTCDDSTVYMREVPTDPSGAAYGYETYTSAMGAPATDAERQNYIVGSILQSPANDEDNDTLTKCQATLADVDTTQAGNQPAEYEVCND